MRWPLIFIGFHFISFISTQYHYVWKAKKNIDNIIRTMVIILISLLLLQWVQFIWLFEWKKPFLFRLRPISKRPKEKQDQVKYRLKIVEVWVLWVYLLLSDMSLEDPFFVVKEWVFSMRSSVFMRTNWTKQRNRFNIQMPAHNWYHFKKSRKWIEESRPLNIIIMHKHIYRHAKHMYKKHNAHKHTHTHITITNMLLILSTPYDNTYLNTYVAKCWRIAATYQNKTKQNKKKTSLIFFCSFFSLLLTFLVKYSKH